MKSSRSTAVSPRVYHRAMELPGLSLRRFTAAELHRMRETGILAPQARIELLAGVLVDLPRPSAREMEVTQRLATMLAEHFEDATVRCGGLP